MTQLKVLSLLNCNDFQGLAALPCQWLKMAILASETDGASCARAKGGMDFERSEPSSVSVSCIREGGIRHGGRRFRASRPARTCQ